MPDTDIPADLAPLLERPLFAALGTVRPDDTVQVNPMWFLYDGEHVRFTHTTKRAKFRNLQHNPTMSLMVFDPDEPQTYIEVRGKLVEVVPDPEGELYVTLGRRYGNPDQQPPPDKADRVQLAHERREGRPPLTRRWAGDRRPPPRRAACSAPRRSAVSPPKCGSEVRSRTALSCTSRSRTRSSTRCSRASRWNQSSAIP